MKRAITWPAAVLSLTTVVVLCLFGIGLANSGDVAMTSAPDAKPLPATHVSLASYHLAVLDTAACSREATGGEVEVMPHADGGFMFEVTSQADPVDLHNACRSEHLDHIELAYMDQSDNPTGEAFYDAVAQLEECHPEIRARLGELIRRDEQSDSLCTPPQ